MKREQLAQIAAEFCASHESDERCGALIQAVLDVSTRDPAWNHVRMTSGIAAVGDAPISQMAFTSTLTGAHDYFGTITVDGELRSGK